MRQYVGARYVPKFFENSATGDSTWAANTVYEPLVTVTWNDNSYISKKPVPASVGAPNLNGQYWLNTGSLSADVGRIESELSALQEDVGDLETGYTTLSGQMTTANGKISTLEGNVSDINGDIDDIQDDVSDLQTAVAALGNVNRKVIVFGDSYGMGGSQSGATYTPYPSLMKARIINCSSCVNISESGRGFTNPSDTTNMTFAQVIAAQTADDTITDVVIAGGYNDRLANSSDIDSGVSLAVGNAYTKYPHARVYVAFIGWSWFASEYNNLNNALTRYKTCQNSKGIFMDNVNWVMHNLSYFDSDHIHPNASGHQALARAIAQFINCGSYSDNKVESRITWPAVNDNVTFRLRCSAENGVGFITNDTNLPINLTVYDARVWANQQIFQLTEEASTGYFRGYNGACVNVPVSVSIDGTNVYFGAATLKLINGCWYFDLGVTVNGAFRNGTLHDVTIPPFTIAIDRGMN